jgi:UDP-3-O-acyl N-acetylglucosamine deacetylase
MCLPAAGDAGIVFARADLPSAPEVKVALDAVSDTRRGLTLGQTAPVRTVEHLLAAAFGLGISNLRVEVRGEELPILDGSAAPYVEALTAAGIADQAGLQEVRTLGGPLWIAKDSAWIMAVPADHFRVTYIVPLPATPLGIQIAEFDAEAHAFADELAPSRTWGFVHELQSLRQAGLAHGASTENALGIGPEGYLSPPRFLNEPARHKILDLVGDLMVLGHPLQAHIVACGGGHTLHIELARAITQSAVQC